MKRFFIVFLCIVMAFSVISCEKAEGKAVMNRYENSAEGYVLYYPQAWVENHSENGYSVRSAEDKNGISSAVLNISVTDDGGKTPYECWQEFSSSFPEEWSFKFVREDKEFVLGEKSAAKIEYTLAVNGIAYRFIYVSCVNNSKAYTLLCSAEDTKFTDIEAELTEILDNFTFSEINPSDEASKESNGGKTVESVSGDYKILCPESWNTYRRDGMLSLKPDTSDASVSVLVFSLPNDKSGIGVYDYWSNDYMPSLEESLDKFTVTKELDKNFEPKLDGVPACRKEYTAFFGGNEYSFAQILCISEGYVYSITFTAKGDDFEKYISGFDKIAESFKFVG